MNITVSDINIYYSMVEIAEGKHNKTKHSRQEYLLYLKCMILVEKNDFVKVQILSVLPK